MHTVGLRNSPAKGLKRMATKVQWDYIEGDTTIGLCSPGHGAAEVFTDFTEELRHAETDPTCKIHKSCCTSRIHSRPKSFARTDLPGEPHQRNPNAPKFEDRSQEGKSNVSAKQRGSCLPKS